MANTNKRDAFGKTKKKKKATKTSVTITFTALPDRAYLFLFDFI